METNQPKICTTCRTEKDATDYPPDARAKDGRQSKCRICINLWMKNHYRKFPSEQMLRRAKARAKREGYEFNLTIEDVSPLPKYCPVFGEELRPSIGQQDVWTYSLDRIDNSKGYIKGNVAIMSYRANRLKNDGSADDHEKIAAWMRKQAANDNARAAERVTIIT